MYIFWIWGGSPSWGGLHPGGALHLGGFSIWGGSPSWGILHPGGFSILWGVLHPGGFSILGGISIWGALHLGGSSIRGVLHWGFSIRGVLHRGVSIWGEGPPSGGVLHPGGVPCDLSHHAFDVTCMLPPHQLRHINSAPAYILLPGHVTCKACWDTHPPPCGQTHTCKNITFANYVCGR